MGGGRSPHGSRTLLVGLNLAYAALIGGLALIPDPPSIELSDWEAHALAFGVQTALLFVLLRRHWSPRQSLVGAASGALIYGLAIEVLQPLVSGRFFEVSDLLANFAGVTLVSAALAVAGFARRRGAAREGDR